MNGESRNNNETLLQAAQKQVQKLESTFSGELTEIRRKFKDMASTDQDGQSDQDSQSTETPRIVRNNPQRSDMAIKVGVIGIIAVILMLIIGAYVKQLDPLLRWATMFVVPIWHAITCITLLVGNCSLNRQRFYLRYIYMNVIGCIGMVCFGFAMLCVAWKESSPTLYVFFAVIHFGLFSLTCLGILFVMRIN